MMKHLPHLEYLYLNHILSFSSFKVKVAVLFVPLVTTVLSTPVTPPFTPALRDTTVPWAPAMPTSIHVLRAHITAYLCSRIVHPVNFVPLVCIVKVKDWTHLLVTVVQGGSVPWDQPARHLSLQVSLFVDVLKKSQFIFLLKM